MSVINHISAILEIVTMVLGIMLAVGKKKTYGLYIALTFAIYVFYDLSRFLKIEVSAVFLSVIFLIATLSIFWAVLRIYKTG